MHRRIRITVRGTVQGVGFRPFVFRLATEMGLCGYVKNVLGAVEIEAEGDGEALRIFAERLKVEAPPLSRISSIEIEEVEPLGDNEFRIVASDGASAPRPVMPPDVATCAECMREVNDITDRRNSYPFTNCTNCGPRFTIIVRLPYDRPNTTMARFKMCKLCEDEYNDPSNRRFHAQPNACPSCGPRVWLTDAYGNIVCSETQSAIRLAGELLSRGCIVAIKGLGGFHIACDARNSTAVKMLRSRKRRQAKPFAIMCRNEDELKLVVQYEDWELKLLKSQQSPIVLLRERDESGIANEVAPKNLYQGVMLPYTPLHAILMRHSPGALIMTSGNVSDEPICFSNDEALRKLAGIADFFLLHDRDIHIPCDDSVIRPMCGYGTLLRRARGYVPFPFELPRRLPVPAISIGADLKNTVCVAQDDWAVLSQHIGDVENLDTRDHMRRTLNHFCNLLGIEPAIVAHDMHPGYHTTKFAGELCEVRFPVQHHYAHVLSCMVEHGIYEPVIGVAFDGTGYGADGTIWGGELLLCETGGFKRLGHLRPMPLAGGESAIRKPARLAFAYAWELLGDGALTNAGLKTLLQRLSPDEMRIIPIQVMRRLNAPMNTSMGRLFDVVSALLGICDVATYEGQAAVELEMAATSAWDKRVAPLRYGIYWENEKLVIDHRPTLLHLIELLSSCEDIRLIAASFHRTVVEMISSGCEQLRSLTGVNKVVLTGGVFQNRLLLEGAVERLSEIGFDVLWHRQVPPNDGGIALGQMAALAFADISMLVKYTDKLRVSTFAADITHA
ncbi:MAG: carbamoyltransferase HypF [Armatimonadetes bacterium]|nr:carbamoyltransferase HypF [Armatimonadota bacterium]